MKLFLAALATPLLLFSLSGCDTAQMGTKAGLKVVPLSIATATGKVHTFSIEVAQSPEEQERGLMFRDSLPENGGMIFPLQPPRIASFWMKNTVIPLDMLFIRSDGTIARIAPETTPYSLEPVTSLEPVSAVLELAGGKAAKLGIAEDDKVSWPH